MIDLLELAKKKGEIQLTIDMIAFGLDELIFNETIDLLSNEYNKKIDKETLNSLKNGEIIHFYSIGEGIKNIVFLQEYRGNILVCYIDSEFKGDYGSPYSYLEVACFKWIGLCDSIAPFTLPYKIYRSTLYEKGLGYFYEKYNQRIFFEDTNDITNEDFIPNFVIENGVKRFNINCIKAEKSLIYFILNRPSCINHVYKNINELIYLKYILEDLNPEYIKKHDSSTKEMIKNIGSKAIQSYLNEIQQDYTFIDIFNDNLLNFFINLILYFNEQKKVLENKVVHSADIFKYRILFRKYRTLLDIEDNIKYKIIKLEYSDLG